MGTKREKFGEGLESKWTGVKANRYDESRHLSPEGRVFALSRKRPIAALLEHVPRGTAIEIAAGTGLVTELLLEKGFHVLATDLSEDMLKRLRQRVTTLRADDRCVVRPGNAFALPEAGGKFDLAVCINLLTWIESKAELCRCINEAARVLRPGGYFLFNFRNRWSPQNLVSAGRGHTRNTIRSLLSEAGLKTLDTHNGSHFRLRQFRRGHFIARVLITADRMLDRMRSPFTWHVYVLARKKDSGGPAGSHVKIPGQTQHEFHVYTL